MKEHLSTSLNISIDSPHRLRKWKRTATSTVNVTSDCEAEVITAFLALTETLTTLAERPGLILEQKDLCELSSEEVRYHGWWVISGLQEPGYLVPLILLAICFLSVAHCSINLLNDLNPGPLKQILQQLGMAKTDFNELGELRALKLLATLCQFCNIGD